MKTLKLTLIVSSWAMIVPALTADDAKPTWPFDATEAATRQAGAAKELAVPKNVNLNLGTGVALKMVLIPAGTFTMGSPESEKYHQGNESPQHEVTITKPFYMGVYKVTQAQYQFVMRKNPSMHKGKANPLDSVPWKDATEFCAKVATKTHRSVRLPTEAQWEWACRAGTATPYFFGDEESKLSIYCWWHDNCAGTTHPVGLKKPNAWGLYDMHGLAWEWCSDFFANSYDKGKAVDPQGPPSATIHSARGGSLWQSSAFPPFRLAIGLCRRGRERPLWISSSNGCGVVRRHDFDGEPHQVQDSG